MITCNTIYRFKEEFCTELGIPQNQYNRRQKELLEWLKNFFDFDFLPGNPIRIHIKEVIGEYRPLPRKMPAQEELNKQKQEDYEAYTIAALGNEFKPNSKSKIARDAISSFAYDKYGHNSVRAVAQRYVKAPFTQYGESNNQYIWVFFSTYEPLNQEELEDWAKILKEELIDEEAAASAFYRHAEGEDISKEVSYYKKALSRYKEKYFDVPVRVQSWRLKINNVEKED
jgi:hypothetical protein